MPIDQKHAQWLHKLLSFPSVSPHDLGAQQWLVSWAQSQNIPHNVRHCHRGATSNMALTLGPDLQTPHLHFVGHTDVVPAEEKRWSYPPFALTCDKKNLYGRGICDMKGAIIAFIAAYDALRKQQSNLTVTLLLTSDEEGSGADGLQHLLQEYPQDCVSFVVIGEPTATKTVGDAIKIGRRGSFHGELSLIGASHHVAYPKKKDPLTFLPELLTQWQNYDWDHGVGQPGSQTHFQITQIQTQDCVENVIPGKIQLRFNFRYISGTSTEQLQQRFEQFLKPLPLEHKLHWRFGARPWKSGLSDEILVQLFGTQAQRLMDGGVSDGYKVAKHLTSKIVEVGLPHVTAHEHDEHISEENFLDLVALYTNLMHKSQTLALSRL